MITSEQVEQLREFAKPLQEFLYFHQCPHDIIVITSERLDLFEGRCGVPNMKVTTYKYSLPELQNDRIPDHNPAAAK